MSWRTGYAHRVAIAVNNTSNAASPKDVNVTVPPGMDRFWTTVQSNGYDVLFTRADGVTAVTYERTGTWNATDRVGAFELHDAVVANGTCMLWMYWGKTVVADPSTSVTPSSPLTGTIHMGTVEPVIVVQRERTGSTRPRHDFPKAAGDAGWVWFDFSRLLMRADGGENGFPQWEEVAALTQFKTYNPTVDDSALRDETVTRFSEAAVGVWLKAGTTGDDALVRLVITTTEGRTIEAFARLRIRTPGV